MVEPRAQQARSLFSEIVELDVADRERMLRERCGGDDELRRQVRSLLEHESDVSSAFLGGADGLDPPCTPGARIGPYRILDVIGRGGCGVVYRARQTRPVERTVALKVIKAGMDTHDVVARFMAEQQALALMDHPNIARIYDAGATDRGRPYFVMEHVPGARINRFCDDERLDVTQRLRLFLQVCDAVRHAHGKGIVHRDLKPSNILVESLDGYPVPKVIDFGIAKAMGRSLTEHTLLTMPGQLVGTPEYMSPEQARLEGSVIDHTSDIYSLGVILYELIAGVPPLATDELRSASPLEIQRMIGDRDPPTPSTRVASAEIAAARRTSPRSLRHRLRGDLDRITMKAMAKRPERRYATVAELAADIRRHLGREPVTAGSPGAWYRMTTFLRRNRATIAATVLLVIVTALAGVLGAGAAVKSERDRAGLAELRERLERHEYGRTVALAQSALRAGETSRLRPLLDRCPETQRNWEWHYLRRLADTSVRTLEAHEIRVGHLAYSPDRTKLATASGDETIRIWDARQGSLLQTLPDYDGWGMSFAWLADGAHIASSYRAHGTVAVWDATDGRIVRRLEAHPARVLATSVSPDGRLVATGGQDGTVKLWAAETWEPAGVFGGHRSAVNCIAWLSDGQRVVSGSWDGTVNVWDVETSELDHTITHGKRMQCVAAHPDGSIYATSARDCTIRIQTHDGTALRTISTGPVWARTVRFSPDGEHLAAAVGQAVMLWRWTDPVATPALLFGFERYEGLKENLTVLSLCFSPDGSHVLAGATTGEVKSWAIDEATEPPRLLGHESYVRSVAVTPDGASIVSAGETGTIRIWDAATRTCRATIDGAHRGAIYGIAVSHDGKRIASCGNDRMVRIWDAETLEPRQSLSGHREAVQAVVFSPDDRLVASAGRDGLAVLWSPPRASPVRTIRHGSRIDDVAFTPDGERIVTGGYDSTVRMWEIATGAEVASFAGPRKDPRFQSVAVSTDGRMLAGGGPDCVLWNLDDPADPRRVTIESRGSITTAVFSPDGERLVSGGHAPTIDVWDARTGGLLLSLEAHRRVVSDIAFAPDGTWFVTASLDGSLAVWDSRVSISRRPPDA